MSYFRTAILLAALGGARRVRAFVSTPSSQAPGPADTPFVDLGAEANCKPG